MHSFLTLQHLTRFHITDCVKNYHTMELMVLFMFFRYPIFLFALLHRLLICTFHVRFWSKVTPKVLYTGDLLDKICNIGNRNCTGISTDIFACINII